jgi:uroporphyrinogen decarboxylase
MERLIRRDHPRQMGVFDLIWPDALRAWTEQGYPTNGQGEPVEAVEHFGFDMDMATTWFDILPWRGHEELVEETDAWRITRNGAGAALKFWKNKSGTPEHIDFRMTSRAVWEKDYRPHLLPLDPQRLDIPYTQKRLAQRRAQGVWTFYGHMFVFENLRRSMGDVCLYESTLLDPDWIHDYNRVYTDFFKTHYAYLFEQAGPPDGIWMYEDLGYKGTTFCSPKVYDDLFFPYYREMVDFFHARNLPVVLHSCGYVEELIPRFLELGFDALNPMEVKAGCDCRRIADAYGDQLLLVGGFDVRILERGDREEIRREVRSLAEHMKRRATPYVFASDHSVSTGVTYPNFKLAVDVFREHSAY